MKYPVKKLQKLGIPRLPGDWDFRSESQQVRWLAETYPDIFNEIFSPEMLINWSELSRYLTKGDRNGIRKNKKPLIYQQKINKLLEYVKEWQEKT